MDKLTTNPIPTPDPPPDGVSHADAVGGQPIPPIERIKFFSADQWEEFITEWVDSLRKRYKSVERCGGAGDKGRDVVALSVEDPNIWDNYQCKHYATPLQPNQVWVELGKLVYYTKRGDYAYPRHYYFVAPRGAGTALSNLLRRPDELRKKLLEEWDKQCRSQITTKGPVELGDDLRAYIDALDFSIFSVVQPLRIIEEHSKTRWHAYRFGGGLPKRPPAATPPDDLADAEANYVRALLDAYGDHSASSYASIKDVEESDLLEHFADARLEFYSAESLRTFSRDTLPAGEFESLKEEVHDGIKDEVRRSHPSGYERVLSTTSAARRLQLSSRALVSLLTVRDRGGVCHQLANDQKVKWVK